MSQPITPTPIDSIPANERMLMAKRAIDSGEIVSIAKAAKHYKVDRNVLRIRVNGANADNTKVYAYNHLKLLTDDEEKKILDYTLDLISRGFPLSTSLIQEFCNSILASRNGGKAGLTWYEKFVSRNMVLMPAFKERNNHRKRRSESSEMTKKWFEVVKSTIQKHDIQADDIYSFGEIVFTLGPTLSTEMVKIIPVVYSLHRSKYYRPKSGQRVTLIQGIGAKGSTIPPFIIFAGDQHASSRLKKDIPEEWSINGSAEGLITNDLSIEWLQHFQLHTSNVTKPTQRLLITCGDDIHNTLHFHNFCKDNDIITVCIPRPLFHRVQPFDIGCTGLMKKAYKKEIDKTFCDGITRFTKSEFLSIFKATFRAVFTVKNIKEGFKATGIIPYDPDAVLSQLYSDENAPIPVKHQPERFSTSVEAHKQLKNSSIPIDPEIEVVKSGPSRNLPQLAKSTETINQNHTTPQHDITEGRIQELVASFLTCAHSIAEELLHLYHENVSKTRSQESTLLTLDEKIDGSDDQTVVSSQSKQETNSRKLRKRKRPDTTDQVTANDTQSESDFLPSTKKAKRRRLSSV